MLIGLATFIILTNIDIGGLKENTVSELSGNLFDKNVLEHYELTWLEKPVIVSEENQYINQVERSYIYECKFADTVHFQGYVENVFNNFLTKDYSLAYLLRDSSFYSDPYNRVKLSENISDFKSINTKTTLYTFYYSEKSKKVLSPLEEGLNIGCLHISFEIKNQPTANGEYTFRIRLKETMSYNVAIDN